MRSLLLLFVVFVQSAWSQDAEKKIEELIDARARSIAQIDEDFRIAIEKIRDNQIRELEDQIDLAMESRDLDEMTAENSEFIELTHENSVVHRLYEARNTYHNPGTKDFRLGSRGKWLGVVDVLLPTQ